jgi:L-lactate dehydrogenase
MKISIIGTGRVGSATAFAVVLRGLAERLVLVGVDRAHTLGDVYDLQHAAAFIRPTDIVAGEIADTAGSDVIVLTAAAPEVGESRLNHAAQNTAVVRSIVREAAPLSPDAVLVVVTNPVDVMTWVALQTSGFPASRVLGTGTLLDTGRFRSLLSQASGVHAHDIRAYILGEHGDSQFAAMSVASYGGVRFSQADPLVRQMAEQARVGGAMVMRHKGHTNYAIAVATAMILGAIRDNTREVLPVSTLVDGYLGVRDVCLSVPCVIGRHGIVRTLPIDLSEQEAGQFRLAAEVVRGVIDTLPPG